jgi:pimeloyl-ACP methyl ester carboxylesterase
MATHEARSAALAWYRTLPWEQARPSVRVGRITVPTLYVWGDRDPALGRAAAEATAGFVRGRYRFEVLAGAGHWVPETRGEDLAALVAAHVAGADPGSAS